jgi:hypothetical protein
MALDTYANLQAALAGWLDRADYTAQIPDFIRMAEAEFDRVLRVPEMEARAEATTVAASGRLPFPADCAGIRSVSLLTAPPRALEGTTTGMLYQWTGSGVPSAYAVSDEQVWLAPIPDAPYTVQLVYWRRIPQLSTANPSNWLLTKHPDLYLMGSLLQAEFYGWNDDRLGLIRARVADIYEQMQREGLLRSRPPVARIRHGVVGA